MQLAERFREYIEKEKLFRQKDQLLLAVSGGVDSVVLCYLCKQAGYNFSIAHCNFQLRGEESERDEQFVEQLASEYGAPFYKKRFDTEKYAAERKVSIQVAARELRYEWFHELTGNQQSAIGKSSNTEGLTAVSRLPFHDWIITAHHLTDNIETLLMNFFKGTGIAGLRGMLPKQGKIVRPLLFAVKEEIRQFAVENNLRWVEDSSNELDKYSRNYIHHQLIPLIQNVYPSAMDNLADNLERFRDIELLYRQAIEMQIEKLVEKKGEELHIPVLKLKKATAPKTILYEIIKEYGFTSRQVSEVASLLESDSGKYISSSTHRILKNRNWLIISKKETVSQAHILVEEHDKKIRFQNGEMIFEEVRSQKSGVRSQESEITNYKPQITSYKSQTTNCTAFLDASEVKFPLLLRKWRPGDYFYPLGMQKKKKLARFFIDQKLSLADKEKTWVLEMDKKIIWVVGMRIDDRFKITGKTKAIYRIEFLPL